MLGIVNDSPANVFAYWVMDGVTDLDQGVLGTLTPHPGCDLRGVNATCKRHRGSGEIGHVPQGSLAFRLQVGTAVPSVHEYSTLGV